MTTLNISTRQVEATHDLDCDSVCNQDILFEEFLLRKFGSMQSYLMKIPAEKDQQLLQKSFDQKTGPFNLLEIKEDGNKLRLCR